MGSKSHSQNNLQNRPSQTIQTLTAYQGSLPPPDMLEKFGKVDPSLPERIVRMAEQTIEKSFRELDIHERAVLFDLENKKSDLNTKQHESETRRIVVEKGAKYDFRAQMIILAMVIGVLGTAIVFGLLGLINVVYVVICGGFATIIIAAIKGVSNRQK